MAIPLEAAMRPVADHWFVRLPDGRVVRAKTTESVRHHLECGRIPLDCWVRRSHAEEWQSLEWTSEFADLIRRRGEAAYGAARPATNANVRGNGTPPRSSYELRTVGVPGLVEELFAALDTTLTRPKLLIAALAAVLTTATLLLVPRIPWTDEGSLVPSILAGLIVFVVVAVSSALLTQITFIELSRLRRARLAEARQRLTPNSLRILVAFLLVGGIVLLALAGLREWPAWLLSQQADGAELLASFATVLALVLEVILWPVIGLTLLLVPIVVIEECGLVRAFRQWLALLHQHLGRILLYEALAFALGAVAVLPFVLPVVAAGAFAPAEGALLPVSWATLAVLGGLAVSPLFAYLVVANVYIYLNLRYEISPTAK